MPKMRRQHLSIKSNPLSSLQTQQLWLRLLPVAKAEARLSQRSSKKLLWALLQVPGTLGRMTSRRKTTPKKSGFPTREEMEARRRREAQKDWVVNHQEESISERYFSIRQQVGQFAQEVKALRFFEAEGKEMDLACRVLAMVDWAVEYNELSNHPLPVIPRVTDTV